MNIFYTYTYGKDCAESNAQKRIAEAAKLLGYREMPVFYDGNERLSIEQCDLDVQMDGSFSSFSNDAILIFQYPSGAGYRYDKAIIDHVKMYGGASVVIYKHPYIYNADKTWMATPEQEAELLDRADLVVEPYQLIGFDEMLITQKEIIDALLAVTYKE